MFIDVVRSCASYLIFMVYCFVIALPALVVIYVPFSYPLVKSIFGLLTKVTCKFMLFCTFCPVTYQGFDQLPNQPTIYIANHQSALDIPLVGSILGTRPCVWLAKAELFEYPVLGQLLLKNGIPVYFSHDKPVSQSAVQVAAAKLKEGYNVVIFPEGGRYNDGTIHPFRSGFAAIAQLSGAPVVPLFISGTGHALAIGQRLIRRAPLMITVGEKMLYNSNESLSSFKERCYQWFNELNFRRQYLLEHFGIRICKTDGFDGINSEQKSVQTIS